MITKTVSIVTGSPSLPGRPGCPGGDTQDSPCEMEVILTFEFLKLLNLGLKYLIVAGMQ